MFFLFLQSRPGFLLPWLILTGIGLVFIGLGVIGSLATLNFGSLLEGVAMMGNLFIITKCLFLLIHYFVLKPGTLTFLVAS